MQCRGAVPQPSRKWGAAPPYGFHRVSKQACPIYRFKLTMRMPLCAVYKLFRYDIIIGMIEGYFESAAPTMTSDRECKACITCPVGTQTDSALGRKNTCATSVANDCVPCDGRLEYQDEVGQV